MLTDDQPNTGITDPSSCLVCDNLKLYDINRNAKGMTTSNSDRRIYTSFIGIGLDFAPSLVETITKVSCSGLEISKKVTVSRS